MLNREYQLQIVLLFNPCVQNAYCGRKTRVEKRLHGPEKDSVGSENPNGASVALYERVSTAPA